MLFLTSFSFNNISILKKKTITSIIQRYQSNGPLTGIKVLDFSRVLAGPYCAQMLGDLGAEVIKIEHPNGDDTRKWGPPYNNGESSYFISCNRNKLSICLNMKVKESKDIIDRLVEKSDIILHNFVTGGAESLGLGYERLSKINPRIIYCSISGFGSTGIYSKKPGYDSIISAMYGMQHITGPEDGEPIKPGVAVTDILTGIYSYGAITTALYERSISGLGQKVETSLMESQLASLVYIASNYLITGEDKSRRLGTAHPSIVPYQNFECSDHKFINLAGGNDSQFLTFIKCLYQTNLLNENEIQELYDSNTLLNIDEIQPKLEYKTNSDRVKNRKQLISLLTQIFKKETLDYWMNVLDGKGIPIGPVRNIKESFTCQQAIDRNMIEYINHPKCGKIGVVGIPVKYSRTPGKIRLPPPLLGQHTKEVLMNMLHYTEDEINSLIQTGAITENK